MDWILAEFKALLDFHLNSFSETLRSTSQPSTWNPDLNPTEGSQGSGGTPESQDLSLTSEITNNDVEVIGEARSQSKLERLPCAVPSSTKGEGTQTACTADPCEVNPELEAGTNGKAALPIATPGHLRYTFHQRYSTWNTYSLMHRSPTGASQSLMLENCVAHVICGQVESLNAAFLELQKTSASTYNLGARRELLQPVPVKVLCP